ncbi:MAG: ABC transporter substrate-binding protein [Actinomycetota bacterium]|nr:ABC transporter substrate-binding protein [Actinomycetota bacterium]
MRGVVAAICLCAITLSVAGCGERPEPTGTSVRLYPVTLQGAAGRPTVLEREPRRILALGRDMAATLRALGVKNGLVEATRGVARARGFDLVVGWSSAHEARGLPDRKSAVPTYIAADDTVRAVERSLADLGVIVGRPLNGRASAARLQRRHRRVTARVGGREVVSVFLDTGFFTTVSDRSLQADMIAEAGGRSIAGSSPGEEPFDLRRLARIDPRYYLASSDSGTTLEALRRNRRTRRLTAIRAGRFRIIPTELLEPGPRIGAGIAAIARALHPDAFR